MRIIIKLTNLFKRQTITRQSHQWSNKISRPIIYACLCTISIAASVLPVPTYAELPVIDVGSILQLTKQLDQLKRQYETLEKSYATATKQLTEAKQLVNNTQGHYGFGGLLNSTQDLSLRQWSPATWQAALQGLAGGNPARYQQLLNAYQAANPTMSQADFEKGASQRQAKRYQHQVKVNRAVSVQATYAFNDIKKHLSTIHELSSRIDGTQNTKSSLDLNARLMAEVAYIATQELKMQALLVEDQAELNAARLSGEAETARSNTLTE